VRLRIHGDDTFHWHKDEAGFTAVNNGGIYYYAQLDKAGKLVASAHRVGPGSPGPAGVPMSVEGPRPKGWSVGELRYPVPSRLLVAGIENYVYGKDYAVLTRLRIPAGVTGSQTIGAKLRYLACTDRVCVPEQADVSLIVPTGGIAVPDARFNDWRRALPRPLASEAHFQKKGERIDIAVPLPANVTIGQPYYFPATDGPIDYGAEQMFRRDGDLLIASLKQRKGDPAELEGVLALGEIPAPSRAWGRRNRGAPSAFRRGASWRWWKMAPMRPPEPRSPASSAMPAPF